MNCTASNLHHEDSDDIYEAGDLTLHRGHRGVGRLQAWSQPQSFRARHRARASIHARQCFTEVDSLKAIPSRLLLVPRIEEAFNGYVTADQIEDLIKIWTWTSWVLVWTESRAFKVLIWLCVGSQVHFTSSKLQHCTCGSVSSNKFWSLVKSYTVLRDFRSLFCQLQALLSVVQYCTEMMLHNLYLTSSSFWLEHWLSLGDFHPTDALCKVRFSISTAGSRWTMRYVKECKVPYVWIYQPYDAPCMSMRPPQLLRPFPIWHSLLWHSFLGPFLGSSL